MLLEKYHQLDTNFAHCAATHCELADKYLRHTAYTMREENLREQYMIVKPKQITGEQVLPTLHARPQGTLHVGHIEYLRQRSDK